jgi:hypothetical protein
VHAEKEHAEKEHAERRVSISKKMDGDTKDQGTTSRES